MDLTLWAESPEEARSFIERIYNTEDLPPISKIYVAKRSPKSRSNNYVEGEYYKTTNDEDVDVYDESIIAPDAIKKLVQWCTCDIMLSDGNNPLLVLEDTTHIVRMNVYQRVPRLVKASQLGVRSLVLQGTRGLDFSKRGDCWGFYRYLQAFDAISKVHNENPSLPIWYLPDDQSQLEAEAKVNRMIFSIITGQEEVFTQESERIIDEISNIMVNGFHGYVPPAIPSMVNEEDIAVVKIGAKPEKKSWREKGSGQMDPYIGMIAAAKYIFCFDDNGLQTKPLRVEFTYLPEGFHFFKNWETSNSLYKTLAFEIADEVVFLG